MSPDVVATNAEEVAKAAQTLIAQHISASQNFLVEAGAGAGKTTSLIAALHYLQYSSPRALQNGRQVACITYTNLAKDQILTGIDSDPRFFVATIHQFFWSVMKPFQDELLAFLEPDEWSKELEKAELSTFTSQRVEYSRGYRSVTESVVSLHHDDIPALAAKFIGRPKFVTRLKSQYPIVLIDEYQDTNEALAQAIVTHCVEPKKGPIFGFFGDEWQQIHTGSVGKIDHAHLEVIPKGTNFRSAMPVVRALNAMRPSLAQAVSSVKEDGETIVFHTNQWLNDRVPGAHSQNDLNPERVDLALEQVRTVLTDKGWDLSPTRTKTLILTHKSIAARQGYPQIEEVFRNNEDFAKLENPVVRFLVEDVEVARAHFQAGRIGKVFEALGMSRPSLTSKAAKSRLQDALTHLVNEADTGTVGSVLAHFRTPPLAVSADVRKLLDELEELPDDAERTSRQTELETLLNVGYQEIVALREYTTHHSPYETEHGVKGAQFENVVVLLGGGWNHYNFPRFLSYASNPSDIPAKDEAGFRRARNLFYVCASRPTTNLALLFTQQLDTRAQGVLESWFGEHNVHSLPGPPA